MTAREGIVLKLNRAQALVLFEWLARLDESRVLPFDHGAEQQVAWMLEGQLEKTLHGKFDPQYAVRLESARREVLDQDDPPAHSPG